MKMTIDESEGEYEMCLLRARHVIIGELYNTMIKDRQKSVGQ